jgi:branched-chain amino acid transport system permease protein
MAESALAKPLDAPPVWRRLWLPLLLFALLAAAPLVFGTDRYVLSLVGRAMIFAIAALSLDLVLGYGALVSFGHAAFIGLGGYAVGIAMEHGIYDGLIGFPLAIAVGAAFALVTGAISLKTRGVYFIMITLAFGQMAYFTAQSLSRYGGDDGLRMSGRSEIAGYRWLEDDRVFYYVVLAALVLVWWLLRRIVHSRFGRVLRGAKENERRMRALGFDPQRYRLVAYVLSGAICALAGALLANHSLFVAPAYMSWQRSGEMIVMVVLGGMGTLTGPILGAGAIVLVEEALSQVWQHWKVIFGTLVVLIALFARGGLVHLIEGRRDR